MRMKLFRVRGFSGFTAPVELGPLEEVNFLYGPNNSGKSNLLRALELYFRLLGAGETITRTQGQVIDSPPPELARLLNGTFSEAESKPMHFHVQWAIASPDLEAWHLYAEQPCEHIETELELSQMNRSFELRVKRWAFGQTDVAAVERTREPALVGFALQIRRLLADAVPFKQEQPILPYRKVAAAAGFPQRLRDALFDARQSSDRRVRIRWALFSRLAGSLSSELGEGAWETTFDRSSGKADVLFLTESGPIAPEGMGDGFQRYAALIAELCLAEERYICLEEPEWRLSPELQRRLVEQAREIIQAGIGPRQFFVTTHSPFLTAGGSAFALRRGEEGPVVERKPWDPEGG